MSIYANNSSGETKRVLRIFHNDGNTTKEVTELYTNNKGSINKIFSSSLKSDWIYNLSETCYYSKNCKISYDDNSLKIYIDNQYEHSDYKIISDITVKPGDIVSGTLESSGSASDVTNLRFLNKHDDDNSNYVISSIQLDSDTLDKKIDFSTAVVGNGLLFLEVVLKRTGTKTIFTKISNIKINGRRVLFNSVNYNDDRNYTPLWSVSKSSGAASNSINSAYNLGKTMQKFQEYTVTGSMESFICSLSSDFKILPSDVVAISYEATVDDNSNTASSAQYVKIIDSKLASLASSDKIKLQCYTNDLFNENSSAEITGTNLSTEGGIILEIITESPGTREATINMDNIEIFVNGTKIF